VVPTDSLLAFAATAFALIVIPGPSVLFVISRGVALGRRAAVATVLGNAAGAYTQVIVVALGLGTLIERSATLFTAVKLVGAMYVVFLGVQAFRHRERLASVIDAATAPRGTRRILREGYVVGITNPKSAVFMAAVLPQFADPGRGHVPLQLLLPGARVRGHRPHLGQHLGPCRGLGPGAGSRGSPRRRRRSAKLGGPS
jgi:threonine/homoserine/homoserine lactone efflux protein